MGYETKSNLVQNTLDRCKTTSYVKAIPSPKATSFFSTERVHVVDLIDIFVYFHIGLRQTIHMQNKRCYFILCFLVSYVSNLHYLL
jgi:hypothetical protein